MNYTNALLRAMGASFVHQLDLKTNFLRMLIKHSASALLSFLCITPFLLLSQAGLGAELNVTRNQLPVALGLYLDHYEDPSRLLTISDILGNGVTWERSQESIPTLGFSDSAHWFNINITSDDLAGKELVLSADSPNIDLIQFYIIRGDQSVESYETGDTVPFSRQKARFRNPVLPFEMSASGNTTQVFMRVTSQSGMELPLTLSTVQELALQEQTKIAFFGGLFVFFILCFCICWIIYFSLRDKQFLGYTMFFGSSLIFFLCLSGMGKVWFWGESVELSNRLNYISGTIMIISFCLLGQSLNLENRYRGRALIVLRFIAYSMIPTGLYFIVLPFDQISGSNLQAVMLLGLFVAIIVFIMAGIAAAQGSKVALYLFCTWSLLIIAYVSMLGYKLNIVEKTEPATLIGELLVISAAIMLLFALAEFVRSKNQEFALVHAETKAKGDFLRNVSREFLTPVHLILANSKRLLNAHPLELDTATHEHMTTVITQSSHLHHLINDLLEMAEIESDNFEPEFEQVEITHLLNETKEMMMPAALEKRLSFDTDYSSANLLLQTDKSRLQHVLLNLLTNAIKFTEKGKIEIGYKAVYYQRKLGIEIFVSDTGIGMSEEFKQKIFQEFSHEDGFSEINPTSTGLGMVIVKRIVEKLGGEITFESSKGRGSEFFIRLPLRVSKL
jgi:signal transduction histidine kinase|tara:strand:- start:3588 stop:5609 length:2022 start_codon:yes stop_codon:yes gene_type:complete